MKPIKKKVTALSKACVSPSISFVDPSQYSNLLGTRQNLFSLINPVSFKYSLKTSFLAIESFIKNKYSFIFIVNISNQMLFNKFYQICKNKNITLLKSSETSAGFLTNKPKVKTAIITLFLDSHKIELIQKESLLINIPLISFNDLSANKFSSSIFVSGHYNSFIVQNFILTLLSVCLEQKYE